MGLGYGVMVAQDILVVLVLVRTRVAQPKKKCRFNIEPALLFINKQIPGLRLSLVQKQQCDSSGVFYHSM